MNWAMPRWTPGGKGVPQPAFSAAAFNTARCLGWLFSSVRDFVHEAFHVHAVLIGVHAAPRADRDMRVAHRVLDEQVRHRIAELHVAGLFVPALELALVAAALGRGRIQKRVDRL